MTPANGNTPPRIAWITGLKGLSCYGVFLHHLSLNLDMDIYYGTVPEGVTWLLSSTPLGVIINGNFYVFLFLTLSAYLIGNTFVNYDRPDLRSKIGTFCLKRYFRLMLPILAYAVLRQTFVLLCGLFGSCPLNPYPSWTFVIKHALYDVFAYDDTALAGPLWMMNHLFAGSYIALLLSLPDRKKCKPGMLLIDCIAFCFMIKSCLYFQASAIFGVLLVDLQPLLQKFSQGKYCRWIFTVLIIAGLLLGGVPSTIVPFPFFLYQSVLPYSPILHLLAAFLLLLGILGEYTLSETRLLRPPPVIRILQTAPLQFLGKISYSMFLVHESVLILLFGSLHKLCADQYHLSITVTSVICIALLSPAAILISWLFCRYVEQSTTKLCNYIRF